MKKIISIFILSLVTCLLFAQERPDLRLKAFIGTNLVTYVEKSDSLSAEYLAGGQGGFGFRLLKKRLMCELDFNFLRYGYQYDSIPASLQINSFELPVNVGYATYKSPLIKHFLYGGITTNAIIKGFIDFDDETFESVKFKAKDIGLSNPTFLMRLGTQLDIAFFNIDVSYSLGLNKAYRQNVRTQTHLWEINFGLIF